MAAASPQIEVVRDEEQALVVEAAPVRSRGVWRVAAAAAVAAALVVAGFLWTGSATMVGNNTTGLETVTFTYGSIAGTGCTNWEKIQMSSTNGTSVFDCEKFCNEDEDCTMYNYQKDPCEPPAGADGKEVCLLFKGECVPTANKCWTLSFKFTSATPS